MKKEMFTLSCTSVTVWTNTLTWFYSSLSLSPSESRQRWPVAFWNLSTISVGPLEPVLDSGGGYDSSAASSIILSSRVNLLSSWNGPEPFYTDPIRSCFSHELGIPTRIRRLRFLPLEIIPLAIVSIINNIINNIIQHSIAGEAKLHSIRSIKISNETIQDHRSVSNKYYSPFIRESWIISNRH